MNYDTYAHLYDLVEEGIPGDVDFYLSEVGSQKGSVLELGAGTGRVTKKLLSLNRPITAIDSSKEMLAKLRQAVPHDPNLNLIHSSIVDLELVQVYPTIIAPFRVFQHLYTVSDQLKALKVIKKHLAPGGQFIFDVFNPDIFFLSELEWNFQSEHMPESAWQKLGIRIEYRSRCDQYQQILHEEYRVTYPDGKVEYIPTSMRYFFRFELEHLLQRAGFTVEQCYGSFAREPIEEGCSDLIWKVTSS